ncbi:glyoxylase-like metal-dependent hydrolase (beta-lactamase superfamily II) [Rhizobium sp. BK650]|uniref:MBL fold metallo-hydrolase n=1 Tax=Rhizobium sp. BK650 TaxID=2586990 RepID=UPI00160D424A|nr:MBL fold metallo-hydrolase [Rhizobium sp. BK650]MBB3659904.1 glyoxylase-like metal-dependent hydrolase (beta-lactamase superfamily II) [Rhizobium sp. BK650]
MSISRRNLFAASAGLAAAAALPVSRNAGAAVPPAHTEIPGVIRRKVGKIEVTALLDGYMEMPAALFSAPYEEAARLARAQFQAPTPRLSPVNAFLINLGDRLVLIDTGAADLFGATLGKLPRALAAAGVRPDQIDAIVLSHMHPDHVGGAIDEHGKPVFANAELIVSEADLVYWHDDAALSQAPTAFKPFFASARAVAKAYANRRTTFSGETELLGALRSVPLPGHTPGHTGFTVSSEGATLLIWADVVHHATFQFAHPEWGPAFDVDSALAGSSRKRAFDQAVHDGLMVTGMHLPFPGFGHVAEESDSYRFVAAEWPYDL